MDMDIQLVRADMEEAERDMLILVITAGQPEEAAAEVPYNWWSAQMPLWQEEAGEEEDIKQDIVAGLMEEAAEEDWRDALLQVGL